MKQKNASHLPKAVYFSKKKFPKWEAIPLASWLNRQTNPQTRSTSCWRGIWNAWRYALGLILKLSILSSQHKEKIWLALRSYSPIHNITAAQSETEERKCGRWLWGPTPKDPQCLHTQKNVCKMLIKYTSWITKVFKIAQATYMSPESLITSKTNLAVLYVFKIYVWN